MRPGVVVFVAAFAVLAEPVRVPTSWNHELASVTDIKSSHQQDDDRPSGPSDANAPYGHADFSARSVYPKKYVSSTSKKHFGPKRTFLPIPALQQESQWVPNSIPNNVFHKVAQEPQFYPPNNVIWTPANVRHNLDYHEAKQNEETAAKKHQTNDPSKENAGKERTPRYKSNTDIKNQQYSNGNLGSTSGNEDNIRGTSKTNQATSKNNRGKKHHELPTYEKEQETRFKYIRHEADSKEPEETRPKYYHQDNSDAQEGSRPIQPGKTHFPYIINHKNNENPTNNNSFIPQFNNFDLQDDDKERPIKELAGKQNLEETNGRNDDEAFQDGDNEKPLSGKQNENISKDEDSPAANEESIPTAPIYPGEGIWAIPGKKHHPYIKVNKPESPENPIEQESHIKPEGHDFFLSQSHEFDKQKENLDQFNFDNFGPNVFQQQNSDQPNFETFANGNFKPTEQNEDVINEQSEDNRATEPSEETSSDEEEFVPIRLYTQVRKYETEEHVPESVLEPRLREVVKDSKIHTVYTEEGYEDSGYDHAGHEKNAENNEGYQEGRDQPEDYDSAESSYDLLDGNFAQTAVNKTTELKENGTGGTEYEISSNMKIKLGPKTKPKVSYEKKVTKDGSTSSQVGIDEETAHSIMSDINKHFSDENNARKKRNTKDYYRSKRSSNIPFEDIPYLKTRFKRTLDESKRPSNLQGSDDHVSPFFYLRTKRFTNDFPKIEVDTSFLKEAAFEEARLQKENQYPYYKMDAKTLDRNSALRYAQDLKSIPVKIGGEMSFYKANKMECDDVQGSVNPIPKRVEGGEEEEDDDSAEDVKLPRLSHLGDKIDCFKAKYFGDEPLDSPFFSEGSIEQPEPIFGELKPKRKTKQFEAAFSEIEPKRKSEQSDTASTELKPIRKAKQSVFEELKLKQKTEQSEPVFEPKRKTVEGSEAYLDLKYVYLGPDEIDESNKDANLASAGGSKYGEDKRIDVGDSQGLNSALEERKVVDTKEENNKEDQNESLDVVDFKFLKSNEGQFVENHKDSEDLQTYLRSHADSAIKDSVTHEDHENEDEDTREHVAKLVLPQNNFEQDFVEAKNGQKRIEDVIETSIHFDQKDDDRKQLEDMIETRLNVDQEEKDPDAVESKKEEASPNHDSNVASTDYDYPYEETARQARILNTDVISERSDNSTDFEYVEYVDDDVTNSTLKEANNSTNAIPNSQALKFRIVKRRKRPQIYVATRRNRYVPRLDLRPPPLPPAQDNNEITPTSTQPPRFKPLSEVFYKDEIKPDEQLNVFADVINNIKNASRDMIWEKENRKPMKFPNPEANRIAFKPSQQISEDIMTNFYHTSTIRPLRRKPVAYEPTGSESINDFQFKNHPGSESVNEFQYKNHPGNEFQYKKIPGSESMNDFQYKKIPVYKVTNQVLKNFMKNPNGGKILIRMNNQPMPIPVRLKVKTPSKALAHPDPHYINENLQAQFEPQDDQVPSFTMNEKPLNTYFVPGMKPPLNEKPYIYSDYMLKGGTKVRRTLNPIRRKRSNYAPVSRQGTTLNPEIEDAVAEEEDDYVPHRPTNFHYDPETRRIVYHDKSTTEAPEFVEVEYDDVEVATDPPKKKATTVRTVFHKDVLNMDNGLTLVDYLAKLRADPSYVAIPDPEPTEKSTTTTPTASPDGKTTPPEFLKFLTMLHKSDEYVKIEDEPETPKPVATTTTTEAVIEEEEEEEETLPINVKNSPGGQFNPNGQIQIFDISEFLPKTKNYSPRTSIDYSKYKTIERPMTRHNLSSRYSEEDDDNSDKEEAGAIRRRGSHDEEDEETPTGSIRRRGEAAVANNEGKRKQYQETSVLRNRGNHDEAVHQEETRTKEDRQKPTDVDSEGEEGKLTRTHYKDEEDEQEDKPTRSHHKKDEDEPSRTHYKNEEGEGSNASKFTYKSVNRNNVRNNHEDEDEIISTTKATTTTEKARIRIRGRTTRRPTTTLRPTATSEEAPKIYTPATHRPPSRVYPRRRPPQRVRTTTPKLVNDEVDESPRKTRRTFRRLNEDSTKIPPNHKEFYTPIIVEDRMDANSDIIETAKQPRLVTPDIISYNRTHDKNDPGTINPRKLDIEVFKQYNPRQRHGGNYIRESEKRRSTPKPDGEEEGVTDKDYEFNDEVKMVFDGVKEESVKEETKVPIIKDPSKRLYFYAPVK